jgi:hypothetical protein
LDFRFLVPEALAADAVADDDFAMAEGRRGRRRRGGGRRKGAGNVWVGRGFWGLEISETGKLVPLVRSAHTRRLRGQAPLSATWTVLGSPVGSSAELQQSQKLKGQRFKDRQNWFILFYFEFWISRCKFDRCMTIHFFVRDSFFQYTSRFRA